VARATDFVALHSPTLLCLYYWTFVSFLTNNAQFGHRKKYSLCAFT